MRKKSRSVYSNFLFTDFFIIIFYFSFFFARKVREIISEAKFKVALYLCLFSVQSLIDMGDNGSYHMSIKERLDENILRLGILIEFF